MVDTKEYKDCSGCTACVSVCSAQCIKMESDALGFKHPVINHEDCINCGICDTICERSTEKIAYSTVPKAYGAYVLDENLRQCSSSGGVFSALAENVIDNGGVVFGAALNSDFRGISHIKVETKEELSKLRGSKYMQSNLDGIFPSVKGSLDSGVKVMFSGTPCQVDGLRTFLRKEYDNLFCVDIICHGVPSTVVWKKYCDEIEASEGEKIESVNFRDKKKSWSEYGVSFHMKTREVYHTFKNDSFMRLFLKNYILRPSCYACSHKGINRNSDITLGDFWGIQKIMPEMTDDKGTSLVFVHTQKGCELFESVADRLIIKETDAVESANYNSAMTVSVKIPERVDEFWQDYDRMSVRNLAEKYDRIDRKTKIKQVIKKIPVFGVLNNIRHRVWREHVS